MESKENNIAAEENPQIERRETYLNPRHTDAISPEEKKQLEEDLKNFKIDENTNLTEVVK
jgi:hypothetical protein